MTIIWCMVPEIWSAKDRISHFGPFFTLFTPPPSNNPKNQNFEKLKKLPGDIIILHTYTINDNHMIYSSWDMKHDVQNFLSFWTVFCLFTPYNPKNQNFEKLRKKPGYIIILHMCTINYNYMMYGSWDIECDWQNVLPFWTIFCPFTP